MACRLEAVAAINASIADNRVMALVRKRTASVRTDSSTLKQAGSFKPSFELTYAGKSVTNNSAPTYNVSSYVWQTTNEFNQGKLRFVSTLDSNGVATVVLRADYIPRNGYAEVLNQWQVLQTVVTLTKVYWMGKKEVTQAEWEYACRAGMTTRSHAKRHPRFHPGMALLG